MGQCVLLDRHREGGSRVYVPDLLKVNKTISNFTTKHLPDLRPVEVITQNGIGGKLGPIILPSGVDLGRVGMWITGGIWIWDSALRVMA